MTYEEAIQTIPCGRYRHFKGKPYERTNPLWSSIVLSTVMVAFGFGYGDVE